MLFTIVHDRPTRMRLRCGKWMFDDEEARGCEGLLRGVPGVRSVVIRPANGSILVEHDGSAREAVIRAVRDLDVLDLPRSANAADDDLGELDNRFQIQLAETVGWRLLRRVLMPTPLKNLTTALRAIGFVYRGIRVLARGRLGVEVLDATAISVALSQRSFSTASTVMFLLHISDLLNEYTEARARASLRQNLSMFAQTVWLVRDGEEVEVPIEQVAAGDLVRVRTGALVPLDGTVVEGEAEVNEASMTGESALVHKRAGSSAFAGTVVDDGSILLRCTARPGQSRIDAIVDMVENSQELKAGAQSRAEYLADTMVPFSLGVFLLTLLVTRDIQRAMSVLMVDYSCAIKLSAPIAVMSAVREGTRHGIVVKGGKFLESLAHVDTVVFDKTGTLTNARPQVEQVISLGVDGAEGGMGADEVLRLAACLEEHFPHSLARAIVREATERGLSHRHELHAEVEYIVAHGIASTVNGKRARIGSAHFIFEDEGVPKPAGLDELVSRRAPGASAVYLALDGRLVGVICVEDPLRPEAADVIAALRERGVGSVVMLTGDSENCACVVASKLGIDAYHSQVLPEDKASYVEELKRQGHVAAMVGDGINDSPALAAADVSIALSDASDIARSVADISVLDASLASLIPARDLAVRLMGRIEASYRFIVTFNSALIVLGLVGVLPAAPAATLHNASTVLVAASNTRPLLGDGTQREPRHERAAEPTRSALPA